MLKAQYDKKDDIPEKFLELYSERDGLFVLTGVEGYKTQADIDAIKDAKDREVREHGETKAELRKWKGLGESPEKVQEVLDDYPVQKTKAEATNKTDDEAIQAQVNALVSQRIAPIERERDQFKREAEQLAEENMGLKKKDTTRTVHEAIRKAASAEDKIGKIVPTAIDDILARGGGLFEVQDDKVIAKADSGITPGVGPLVWLQEMQKVAPHWWQPSKGGGAGGGKGDGGFGRKNPWDPKSPNKTDQGAILRQDPELAKQMAASAGVDVFTGRPTD